MTAAMDKDQKKIYQRKYENEDGLQRKVSLSQAYLNLLEKAMSVFRY